MLYRIKTQLPVLCLVGFLSPSATAQWNQIDRSKPFALEACAAVNYQLERWETGVFFLEKVTRSAPEDGFAALWLAQSLSALEPNDRALAACRQAARFPEVRAAALVELASNQALLGDMDGALDSLEEALASQLVDRAERLASDPAFRSLRQRAQFKAIQKELAPIGDRVNALSRTEDFDGLVALFHADHILVEREEEGCFGPLLEELQVYGRSAARGKGSPQEADRLRLIGRAYDATVPGGRMLEYVEAWLGWTPEQIEAEKRGWSTQRKLVSGTRSHRFAHVIRLADELGRDASSRGDLIQLYMARINASLAHMAVVDFGQTRKGFSAQDETRMGAEKAHEALAIARSLGLASGVVRCLDFLASHEVNGRVMRDADFDQLICEAVTTSNRLVPKARDLGMWEDMWRKRRTGDN